MVEISKWTKLSRYLNNCQIGQPLCSKFENGKSDQNGQNGFQDFKMALIVKLAQHGLIFEMDQIWSK